MKNQHTASANTNKKEYVVWADCNRRCYQAVSAASPEEAYRIAKDDSGGWEFCSGHESNGYRLSDEVQATETGEFIRVGGAPAPRCKTCGSEIVQTVNEGAFRDGECGGCEYARYKSQPNILDAARRLYDLIDGLREGGCALFDESRPLLDHCYSILTQADETFPEPPRHESAA